MTAVGVVCQLLTQDFQQLGGHQQKRLMGPTGQSGQERLSGSGHQKIQDQVYILRRSFVPFLNVDSSRHH